MKEKIAVESAVDEDQDMNEGGLAQDHDQSFDQENTSSSQLELEERTDRWVEYGDAPYIRGRPIIYLVFHEHDCGSLDCVNDCFIWCPLGAFWDFEEAKEYSEEAFEKIYGANIKPHRRRHGRYDGENDEGPLTPWEVAGVDRRRGGFEFEGVQCRVIVWPLCLVGTRRDRAKKWSNWEGEPLGKKRKLDTSSESKFEHSEVERGERVEFIENIVGWRPASKGESMK